MKRTPPAQITRWITEAVMIWRRYWLLRWTTANIIGWSLALLSAMLLLEWFGFFGAVIGGGVAGLIAGGLQSLTLTVEKAPMPSQRRWILMSMLGGLAATIPVYLLGFVALLSANFGLLLMGAFFGGLLGAMQGQLLREDYDDALLWWVGANIIAGGACAPLTLTPTLIPLFGTVGPVVFGLLTGLTLRRMRHNRDDDEFEVELSVE